MKRKYILVISILILAILFGTAATCNMCGLNITPTASTETLAGSETSAETSPETIAEITKDTTESSVSASATETSKETTSKETASATNQTEIPTIKLQIYEGPTSATGDVCYYRVEATVTGKPAPQVTFSKDDSSGAFGPKKVQVNLTKSSPSYTLTAKAKNSAGEVSDLIALSWGCEPLNNPPVIDTISLISNGTIVTSTQYDVTVFASDPDGDSLSYEWTAAGGVLKGSESNPVNWATPDTAGTYNIGVKVSDGNGGEATKSMNVVVAAKQKIPPKINVVKTINLTPVITEGGYVQQDGNAYSGGLIWVGDSDIKKASRGYISYDIISLAGTTIQSATLTFKIKGVLGNPSNFGELWVGIVDWGAHPLVLSDFDLPGTAVQSFSASGGGNFTCNADVLKTQLQSTVNSGKTRFQVRIHFSILTDMDSLTDEWIYNQSDINLNVTYIK